ncbi:MAG: S24 family peptidase [Reyranella sp.]
MGKTKQKKIAPAVSAERGLRRLVPDVIESASGTSYSSPLIVEGLGGRISALISMFPTQKAAAAFIEKSPVTLQNWTSGSTIPPFDVLARLAISKGVRLEWLATGKGAMLEGERDPALNAEYVFIPRYDVRASAGHGQPVLSEDFNGFLAFRQDWIRQRLRRSSSNLAVIEAYGDSMHPTISDGDVMLVDISENQVRGSAIYVVLAGNDAVVKRVELRLDGSLLVKSDNPAYEPIILPRDDADELRVIGKVVWTGGLV